PRSPPLLSGGIADLGQLGVLGSKVAFERGVATPSAPNVCSWLLSELPGTADEDTPRMIFGIIQLDDQLFVPMNTKRGIKISLMAPPKLPSRMIRPSTAERVGRNKRSALGHPCLPEFAGNDETGLKFWTSRPKANGARPNSQSDATLVGLCNGYRSAQPVLRSPKVRARRRAISL